MEQNVSRWNTNGIHFGLIEWLYYCLLPVWDAWHMMPVPIFTFGLLKLKLLRKSQAVVRKNTNYQLTKKQETDVRLLVELLGYVFKFWPPPNVVNTRPHRPTEDQKILAVIIHCMLSALIFVRSVTLDLTPQLH